jgi:hypothetical protein
MCSHLVRVESNSAFESDILTYIELCSKPMSAIFDTKLLRGKRIIVVSWSLFWPIIYLYAQAEIENSKLP